MERIEKPWGYELIWAKTDRYAGKILVVNAGCQLSLQYHQTKDETIYVLNGRLALTHYLENETPVVSELGPGESFHIGAGLRHRMKAIEDCKVLEVSSPELDDLVRLKDDFGRA